MATTTQMNRSMAVATPLPFDALLLLGFSGDEGVSQLFHYQLDLAAPDASLVAFDRLLGGRVSIRLALPGGGARFISGICAGLSQGARNTEYTAFGLELVPPAHLLTLRARSKIYQGETVPGILKAVFKDIPDVAVQTEGVYHPRDFCVQYRETDFNFASRLMEEEGIYYYFEHASDACRMIITDRPAFPKLQPGSLILQSMDDSMVDEQRITHFEKAQRLTTTKITLRDHTFELPHQTLEAEAWVPESVPVGRAQHRLRAGTGNPVEIYDWPGEYAQRFDGLDRGGHDRPREHPAIFKDNKRTAELRAAREAAAAFTIRGAGRYRHLCSGYTFGLAEQAPETYVGAPVHDGEYVVASVSHVARVGESYRSGGSSESLYQNSFTCVPAGLPYKPPRLTPKPLIQGAQSAVVVGPPGEEIHTDRYGRVRVRFHWDREARGDDSSSCWIRVAQIAAGGGFGGIHIPRVGQEVVVQFEEGDPDRPIIVGSVYNPANMPPYKLPAGKMISGLRSNTYPRGGGMNEITVNDSKGAERMFLHAQYNHDTVVGNNRTASVGVDDFETVGANQTVQIKADRKENVGGMENYHVAKDRKETVDGERHLVVKSNNLELVQATKHVHVVGDHNEKTDGAVSLIVGTSHQEKTGTKYAVDAGQEIHLKAGMKVVIEAGVQLTIKGPGGFVDIGPAGVTIQGLMVLINSGGAAGAGSGSSPTAASDAKPAG